jgi:hypothetical protein
MFFRSRCGKTEGRMLKIYKDGSLTLENYKNGNYVEGSR